MFVSTIPKKELIKYSEKEQGQFLGCADKDFYIPPKCPHCKEALLINDMDNNFGQCLKCSKVFNLYYFE